MQSNPERTRQLVILGLILIAVAAAVRMRPTDRHGAGPVAPLQGRLDPNEAAWWELARLPGLGESLARRIVAYRDAAREARGDPNVFPDLESLTIVRGLGGRKAASIARFLRFTTAGGMPRPLRDGATQER